MSQLLIIDGFSLAFRAFYAFPLSLTSKNGMPINAFYGFVSLLFNAIDLFSPSHIIVCFDHPKPTFRHDKYPKYKSNRSEAPDEFKQQIPLIKDICKKIGVPQLEYPGFEADDIMGSFSIQFQTIFEKIFIYTGDHDTFQLVNDTVNIIIPKKGLSEFKIYDVLAVVEKYGVSPSQIVDFKALKGDSSDNIPGVAGVGDKTASKLLNEYDSLNNLYNQILNMTNLKLQKKLLDCKEDAFVSQDLAQIKSDLDLSFSKDDLLLNLDWFEIKKCFSEHSFASLL